MHQVGEQSVRPFYDKDWKDCKMYMQNIDTKLQKKVQSKEFEESVDQAVRSFMYELDFMLLEEQHTTSNLNYSCIQPDAAVKWINPD
jgi:hypothetical protein